MIFPGVGRESSCSSPEPTGAPLGDRRGFFVPGWRAAARMANLAKGGDSGIHKSNPSIYGLPISQSKAQDLLKVGESSLTRAKKIQRVGSPELVAHHGTA